MSQPQEPIASPNVGSWGSMLTVLAEQRADADEVANTPSAAHTCGEPWTTGPDGVRFCEWDGATAPD